MLIREGRELLVVIEKLGPLEWQRFESRYPTFNFKGQKEFSEDRSSYPPYTSFRFENEDPKIIDILQYAVETYKGKIEWIMYGKKKEYGSGTNRVILPKVFHDNTEKALNMNMALGQYMSKYQPDFGPVAYEDLVGLTEHVKEVLRNNNIEL